jgi:hypothetical protein
LRERQGPPVTPEIWPGVIFACSALRVTPVMAVAKSATGQEQDYDDDEQDLEHGAPPKPR